MKELKTVTMLLGTMLTKEELDDFMAEADAVSKLHIFLLVLFLFGLFHFWQTSRLAIIDYPYDFLKHFRMEMESWTTMNL